MNKKRSFVLSDSTVTLGKFKTFDCEEKIFRISENPSCVAMVSGSGRFSNQKIKDLIDEYLTKTKIEDINSVEGIKNSFNDFISRASPKITTSMYIKDNLKYAILCNCEGNLETVEDYSVHDCKSTMIFTISQCEDIELNLTGIDDNSFNSVKDSIMECLNRQLKDEDVLRSVREFYEKKLIDIKLKNIEEIIEHIEYLPECEILNFFEVLIQLTSLKLKFSKNPHTVGGKRVKAILRKYDGIKFVE